MKPKPGKRYRIDLMGHEADCLVGTLERIEGLTGYLMRGQRLYAVPLDCLRIKGVLQSVPEPTPQPEHFVRVFDVLEAPAL